MDDETVEEVMARQRALITVAQAAQCGLSESAVRHRVRRGAWSRRRRGLYASSSVPQTWEQDALGATLVAGDLAWVSHGGAARLWGLPDFEHADVEITVPLTRQPRVEGVVVHRSGLITEADVGEVDGTPCMRAARTIVDLSGRLTIEALERAVDNALRSGVLTIGGLGREILRFRHIAPGRSPKSLEQILRDRTPGFEPSKSELERRVYRVIVAAGLPEPVRQFKVVINGSTYYLDMAYPDARVAIEVDGYQYRRERGPFDADRTRQNALVLAKWTVLRFTSRSSDEKIVRDVTDALFV